jgi:hypothetical protein
MFLKIYGSKATVHTNGSGASESTGVGFLGDYKKIFLLTKKNNFYAKN